MATIDFGELDVFAGYTEDLDFTLSVYAPGPVAAELAAEDVLHFVLSERTRGEPVGQVLDIASDEETAGESRVYVTDLGDAEAGEPAAGYVRIAQADTAAIVAAWDAAVTSKRYVGELYFVDASESNPASAKKVVLRGVIHLHRSGA